MFQTSVLSLASGESMRPESAAKRAERTPGAPRERVDFEAGVVGEDQLAGEVTGVIDGFEGGVGGEGGAVLFGGGDFIQVWERIDFERMSLGGSAEVAEFALAGGGGVEAKRHEVSVTGAGGKLQE